MTSDDVQRLFASFTDLDIALRINDFSNETLLELAERLEQSQVPRHFLLREAELDDIWRYVEASIARAEAAREPEDIVAALKRLLGLVMEAHDLAGDGEIAAAAGKLRTAMSGV